MLDTIASNKRLELSTSVLRTIVAVQSVKDTISCNVFSQALDNSPCIGIICFTDATSMNLEY